MPRNHRPNAHGSALFQCRMPCCRFLAGLAELIPQLVRSSLSLWLSLCVCMCVVRSFLSVNLCGPDNNLYMWRLVILKSVNQSNIYSAISAQQMWGDGDLDTHPRYPPKKFPWHFPMKNFSQMPAERHSPRAACFSAFVTILHIVCIETNRPSFFLSFLGILLWFLLDVPLTYICQHRGNRLTG